LKAGKEKLFIKPGFTGLKRLVMKFYVKRGWIIFIGSCTLLSVLGLLFLLFDKKIFIPAHVNDTDQNIIVNGWPIVVIGIVSLLFGLLIKWAANNEKPVSTGPEEPPRTELVDKKYYTHSEN